MHFSFPSEVREIKILLYLCNLKIVNLYVGRVKFTREGMGGVTEAKGIFKKRIYCFTNLY